jgi:hypothetical protein
MPLNRDSYSIIRPWASADFTAHTYNQVYVGADSTVTINGVSVVMAAATTLDFNIASISADTASVYVLGDNKNVTNGSTNLGSISL